MRLQERKSDIELPGGLQPPASSSSRQLLDLFPLCFHQQTVLERAAPLLVPLLVPCADV